MMQNIDKLLQEALSPTEEMSNELKAGIIMRVSEEKEKKMRKLEECSTKRKSFSATAAIVVVAFMVTSVTAFAAWKYLSAEDAAQKIEDGKLAEAFGDEDLWRDGEVQSCGGYDISMLGVVSGRKISDYLVTSNDKVIEDATYTVVAIGKSDGTPMPDTSSDEYGKETFLISPYIEGYNPALYNVFTLEGGGYSAFVENGIEYRIMHTRNIEVFADHTIYLGVSDGTFYNGNAYIYDSATGKITRNESYDGVNALFTLSIDPSKADAEKAAEIIERIENPTAKEDTMEDIFKDDVEEFMSKLTVQNIAAYAKPIESTRQTITPNEKGEYSYSYVLPTGAAGNGTALADEMFPDGKPGMSKSISYSASEDGLKDLLIQTHTLNVDGTVTFVIYIPKNQ